MLETYVEKMFFWALKYANGFVHINTAISVCTYDCLTDF